LEIFYLFDMVKKIQYLFVLIVVFALVAGFSKIKGKNGSIKTIVIDAGHGGLDPGCKGAVHNEKDVALAVALKLGKLIEENLKDVKVIYTRTTDIYVGLEERAQIANKAKADLFISIHCNAAGKPVMVKDKKTGKKRPKTFKNKKGKIVVVEKTNPIPFGTETYVMGMKNEEGKMKVATRENSVIYLEDNYETKYGGFDPESEESYITMINYTSAYVIQSANLAVKIQEEYTKKAGRIDKGVHRQSIWVLWRTAMPSILTELGFLTNPLEETFLGSAKGQEYLAKSIFRGLRKYKDEIENQTALENENVKAGNILGQKTADDDEDEEEKEVKKTDGKNVSASSATNASTGSATVEIKKDASINQPAGQGGSAAFEPKEKVNDGRYVEFELKNRDTLKAKEGKADTLLSAKEIADKFRKDQNIKEKAASTGSATITSKKDISTSSATNDKIVFKVQFASSDVELNLKQEKFAGIIDGNFYKVKNVLKYTSGNFLQIKDASAHQNVLREKGFKDCFVIAMKKGERMDVNEAKKETGQ
jgi:N-acetylmuramoyl-L-alanine amidase